VFHVSICGGLEALFGESKHPKAPPWRRDWSEHKLRYQKIFT